MAAVLPGFQLHRLGTALCPPDAGMFSWVVAAFSDAAAMGVALVTLLAVPLSAGFFVVRPYEEAAWAVFYRDITAAEAETE